MVLVVDRKDLISLSSIFKTHVEWCLIFQISIEIRTMDLTALEDVS